MNPNLLKQLAIIVKQGSLTSACEQLHVTQPTLSRSIQQLEMKVGAPLLKRTRYGVIPTEIGARLSQIGERILAESVKADEVIRQFHSGYKSEFVVGIDPLWEFATVKQMTDYFLTEKRYAFHFRTGSAAAQIGLLQEGELDFLIAPAHLSVTQKSLDRQILFRDRAGIFAGKKSKLIDAKQPISKADIAQQKWIIAGASAGFLESQAEVTGVDAAQMAFTGSIRSVIHLLNTTNMLVWLPARLALMTKEINPQQMLQVEGVASSRRDIALWSSLEHSERPEVLKVRQIISDFMISQDQTQPLYGLDL
ncbi:LysR family transcriptional regulator [Amphritea sp.]|uniref:LysR family transcriptional regulator n=1 Tax=Amphritea sp. TaxID=1872502 RepID=UPI003A9546A8